MIILKTKDEIKQFKKAGWLSAKVLREVGYMCNPGISTLELDELAEHIITIEGGIPAFKGYNGFPASICASVNNEVIHGIPKREKILQEGDIISIDTGAIVDGWVGDNAWTFAVGSISKEKQLLLDVTEQCMWESLSKAIPGNTIGDIGSACQKLAKKYKFGVVREYVGHGVGRVMHEEPSVPNYGKPGSGCVLKPGMTLAIEPMINAGSYKTCLGSDGWLVTTYDNKPSAHFEKSIAITDSGYEILTCEPDYLRPVD